jgi:hypothetical protein
MRHHLHDSLMQMDIFIHRMQMFFKFSFNMQLIIHTMRTFLYQFFIHILQHFFSNFHCQMLHNLDETLQNG